MQPLRDNESPPRPTRQDGQRLWWLQALVIIGCLAMLWSYSYPGIDIVVFLLAGLLLSVMGLLWLILLIVDLAGRRRGLLRYAIPAAVVSATAAVVMFTSIPLDARFALSMGAFDDVAATIPPFDTTDAATWAGEGTWPTRDGGRLGAFTISEIEIVPEGLIFHEEKGAVFNNAGFAYLPGGPNEQMSNGSFEGPEWHHISGPWYSWVASW